MERDVVLARGATYDECMEKVKMFSKMGYVTEGIIKKSKVILTGQRLMFGHIRSRNRPTEQFSVEMVKPI